MGEILRHKKTGGLYEVLFRGAQIYIHDDASLADDDLVTVYQVPGDQIAVVPLGATVDNYVSYLHSARTQTATGLICGDEVVVYRNVVDGRVWVRPTSEMDDGRFEPAQAIEARQGGDAEGGSVADKSAVAAGDVPASKSEDQPPSSTPGEVERLVDALLEARSRLVIATRRSDDDIAERQSQFEAARTALLSHISTAGRASSPTPDGVIKERGEEKKAERALRDGLSQVEPASDPAGSAASIPGAGAAWISVEDKLPGEQGFDSEEVLLFLNGHCEPTDFGSRQGGGWGIRLGFYDAEKGYFRAHGRPDHFVTHWMPLPPAPRPSQREG